MCTSSRSGFLDVCITVVLVLLDYEMCVKLENSYSFGLSGVLIRSSGIAMDIREEGGYDFIRVLVAVF